MSTAPSAMRIVERCDELARLSEQEGGLTRVFLSPQQRAASSLVTGWMRTAGMVARIDAIGNCVGRYEGTQPGAPCLMLGSHLDTVRDAGRYDGMLGVVAAIECVQSLSDRGVRLPHAIEVVGFADEEGVRFGATLLGSRAVAGTFDPALLERRDRDGISMREALIEFGLDPDAISSAARSRSEILAYAELHIEQGPVLEAEGLAVGVVTAINGASRFSIAIDGMAGHAGTVPMTLRQDALAAAAECILAIEARAVATAELVATVGRIEARPGATNVIAGHASFSLDVRSPSDADRLAAVRDMRDAIERVCAKRRVSVRIEQTHEGRSAVCAPWMRRQIGAAVLADGFDLRELPSGAGHDAMALVEIAPVGMLFVRCRGGVSHHPAEAIESEDAGRAARVFLRFIENFHCEAG